MEEDKAKVTFDKRYNKLDSTLRERFKAMARKGKDFEWRRSHFGKVKKKG